MNDQGFKFPNNFLWGAATSAHQVEGDNLYNDWWEWEQSGRVNERSGKACDHWNRFRDDFKLAKSLHHNAHRFSIEWSRIEPAEGKFDAEAIQHYREVIECLKQEGLEPIVTLHHFTLPLWVAREGGWCSAQTPERFARYAKKIAETIGKHVRFWITINEPEVYIFKSYLMGDWPPGENSYDKAYRVATHLLKGHVLAYAAIKEVLGSDQAERVKVGFAKHVAIFTPCSEHSWKDKISAWIRNLTFNHLFIKALIQGRIVFPGVFQVRLPYRRTLDFIGLNYYTRDFVHNKGLLMPGVFGGVCTLEHHRNAGKRNFLHWEIYPQGLSQLAKEFARYRLPILISENGICTNQDEERAVFIKEHLHELIKAIKAGAPVMGYLYWSLLDNYEWADGFSPRFGLIEVDYRTQERRIKPSAREYAEICRSGMLLEGS